MNLDQDMPEFMQAHFSGEPNADDGRFVVPSNHAPRVDDYVKADSYEGLQVRERETDAFIHCENPVEVER